MRLSSLAASKERGHQENHGALSAVELEVPCYRTWFVLGESKEGLGEQELVLIACHQETRANWWLGILVIFIREVGGLKGVKAVMDKETHISWKRAIFISNLFLGSDMNQVVVFPPPFHLGHRVDVSESC